MQFFVRLFVCNTATTRLAAAAQPSVHMSALMLISRRQDSTRQGQGLGSEPAACNPGSTSAGLHLGHCFLIFTVGVVASQEGGV